VIGGTNRRMAGKPHLLGVCARDYDLVIPLCSVGGGKQQAPDGPELPTESQLAIKLSGSRIQRRADLAGGQQDTEGDRQVESPAFFGKVRRRETYGDMARGECELGVGECCTDALLALLHDGCRQAHHTESRQSGSEADFDLYQWRVQTDLRAACDRRECRSRP
jgi:hypothetical protein